MPRRSSKKTDGPEQEGAEIPANEPADSQLAQEPASSVDGKNPAAVALGRLGGKKGGVARAKNLTAEERREIAKKAAAARWKKKKSPRKPSDQTGG